jgi:hypothetical protein
MLVSLLFLLGVYVAGMGLFVAAAYLLLSRGIK